MWSILKWAPRSASGAGVCASLAGSYSSDRSLNWVPPSRQRRWSTYIIKIETHDTRIHPGSINKHCQPINKKTSLAFDSSLPKPNRDVDIPCKFKGGFAKPVRAVASQKVQSRIFFIFIFLKKQNFKNICRIGKFSKMCACRPRLSPTGWATGPKCKKIYI